MLKRGERYWSAKYLLTPKKRWVKFGKCANSPGIEAGITYQGDDVAFVLGEAQKVSKQTFLLIFFRNKEKEKNRRRRTNNKSMLCTKNYLPPLAALVFLYKPQLQA